jgi:predicted HAD superfamily hydrolase
MHIGDNAMKDGEMARENGINTLIIPRALEQYRRDNPSTSIPQDLSSKRILGEKIARQYNSPFA